MKAYFSTPEWVQKDLLLREGWPMQLMGTAAQNCMADPSDTSSLQLGLLDQKRVNKPLFLELMVKFMVTLMRLNFHLTNILEVTIVSCMCPFFTLKLLSQITPGRPPAPTLDSFLIVSSKSCFWLQTVSHFLAEDSRKPPSPRVQGHRDPFLVSAKLRRSEDRRHQPH